MADSPASIVESRTELMISPTVPANPISRTAHFLKPSFNSNPKPVPELPPLSLPSIPPTFDPQSWPLKVDYSGWKTPPEGWNEWVQKMASLHAPTWKKAGIHDAILNSTYTINRNRDLIFGVAERWCPETNSFVFPWGEASITLEDMLISGFSVLGFSVFEPIKTPESEEIQQKLVQARMELVRSRSQRALHTSWLKKFMNTGSEIEHEAFLSLWLSRFVLPTSRASITECDFPIAVHLARGVRIALAPTVLASIYRDLTLLKQNIVALTTLDADSAEKLAVTLWSPFQLVLIWVWERFVKLSPRPNVTKKGEPRFAQWNNAKCVAKTVRLVFDSSKESFCWRPYAKPLENWDMPKFYGEKAMWVSVNSGLDEELLSFIRCLRASGLVGLDCIVEYLPHRVSRQFGFDQDIAGCSAGLKTDLDDAWSCYSRPVTDVECYVPSRFFEADVTKRYLDWWNSLGFGDKGIREKTGQKLTNLHQMIMNNLKKKRAKNVVKKLRVSATSSIRKRNSRSPVQMLEKKKIRGVSGAPARQIETCASGSNVKTEKMTEMKIPQVPPGFTKKCDKVEEGRDSNEEGIHGIPKILKSKEKHDSVKDKPITFNEIRKCKETQDGTRSNRKCWSDWKSEENEFGVRIGESQSYTSSFAGNEILKDVQVQEGINESDDDFESINESTKAALLSVENTIQRVEKLFAATKGFLLQTN